MMTRLALCLTLLISLGTAALAHSKKEGTTPADGASLTAPPPMIEMVFDDPMRVTMARLVDDVGTEHPLTRETGMEPTLDFRATPAPLPPGRYTVEWRGLASDGHAMQGSFSFDIAD